MSNEPERPNFIVISTDQQRYDTLGATGNEFVSTPNLDALADRGVLFTRSYVQAALCIPSRACLHTGRYIHQHGVQYMEDVIDTTPALPPWEKTFMERLQEAGYVTGAVGKIHMMQPKGYDEMALTGGKGARWTRAEGLPIGPGPLYFVNPSYTGPTYKAWLEERHPGGYEEIYQQRRRPEYRERLTAIVNTLPADEYVDYWIAEEAIGFLNRREESEPFFLWVGFCGPHGPLDPPRRYAEMYPVEEMPLPKTYWADIRDKPGFMQARRLEGFTGEGTELIRRCIAHYWAMVTQIDDMVGRIEEALEKNGQAGETMIIFTSDHGDMMGDFGMMAKSNFYEPVIRVPTIVVPPQNLRVSQMPGSFAGLAENMSVAPTVLDYAGVERPPEMTATSWRPILEGRGKSKEGILCEHVTEDRARRGKCVRTERYKLAMWGRNYGGEFYDLEEDPLEERNLYEDGGYAAVRETLKDLLLELLAESEDPPYTQWLDGLPEHVSNPGQSGD